jgi:transketolase
MHTVKPIDKELIIKYAKKTARIVTVEEHSVIGGLGAAVAEVLSEGSPVRMLRIGVEDVFGGSGPAKELLDLYGFTPEKIADKIMKKMKD